MVHLTERFNGKDVYLVGTANSSTMLAQRTKKLIEEIKPDTVMVQTSAEWWDNAKLLKYIDSQEELNRNAKELDRHCNRQSFDFYYSNRMWVSLARLCVYNWLFRFHFGLRPEMNPMRPGLEIKFACEAADHVGANLEFLGSEFSPKTWQSLLHETRFNVLEYLMRRFQTYDSRWTDETLACREKLAMVGPQAFSEKCLDTNMMNWFIQSADLYFPKLKKILIDEKDEHLFKKIDNTSGEKIVVVVN